MAHSPKDITDAMWQGHPYWGEANPVKHPEKPKQPVSPVAGSPEPHTGPNPSKPA